MTLQPMTGLNVCPPPTGAEKPSCLSEQKGGSQGLEFHGERKEGISVCDERPAGTLFLSLNLMYPVTPQHLPASSQGSGFLIGTDVV